MSSGQIIFDYFKKHWARYVVGIVIVVISTYLGTLLPKYMGFAIDALNASSIDLFKIRNIALIMGTIAILSFVTRFIWRYLIFGFCRQIEFYLRENLFRHLQKLSEDYYTQNNTGDIITRSIVDVQAVRMMMGFATIALIDAVITSIMCVVNMSQSTNLLVTIIVLAPVPFILFIIVKVKKSVKNRYVKVQESVSDISSKVSENITGIRVMKAFSQEEKETKVFEELSLKKLYAETKLARASALINPSIGLIFGFVFSVFLVVGGLMVSKKSITLGEFVAFNSYLLLIMGPVGNVGRIVDRWQRGVSSLKRLNKILLSKPTIDDSKADFKITDLQSGEIEFRNVNFSYRQEKIIFNDLSFRVSDGQSLAIMGPIGCGKSTIASLITRIWGTLDSKIFIDGKDINTIPINVLRHSIGYVPQENFLFSDTIMENIRFFNPQITEEEIYKAAQIADVHENIMKFPNGYQTLVGERGMTLSGGQKQRIALARALVRNPKILLLDDCMSAIDSSTEKNIIENLRQNKFYSTMVIITHRLSVASLADNVLLLGSNGNIEGYGPSESLLSQNSVYQKMAQEIEALNEG